MILTTAKIYECPICSAKVYTTNIVDYDVLETQFFSDGKLVMPLYPEPPTVTCCNQCSNIYYLNKDNQVNDLFKQWHELDRQIAKAVYLSINESLQAIDKGLFDPFHDELNFRQRIWWLYNDRTRDGKPIFETDSEHEIWHQNLDLLLKLLDIKVIHHRIMAAEIYRNLGEFDAAIDILSDFYPKDQVLHREAIISESQRKNKYVVRVDKFLLTDKTGFKQYQIKLFNSIIS